MKAGLLIKGERISPKITDSLYEIYRLGHRFRSNISSLVIFDEANPNDFKRFDYSTEHWLIVFNEYLEFSTSNSLPNSFIRALIQTREAFDIVQFANAVHEIYNQLNADRQRRFINDIYRVCLFSSKNQQNIIIPVLNKYNSNLRVKEEKIIISEAIEYGENLITTYGNNEIKKMLPLGDKNIFVKISYLDAIIDKIKHVIPTNNPLIKLLQWKNDLGTELPLNTLVEYFYCFGFGSQLKIFRKIIHEIEVLSLNIDDFIRIIDTNTSIKEIHEKYNFQKNKLAFKLLFYSLKSFETTGKFLSQGKILDLLNNLRDKKAKVNLGEKILFDFCNGGLLQDYKYNRANYTTEEPLKGFYFDKAGFLQNANYLDTSMTDCLKYICNGRLASEKDDIVNRDFLWCNGQRCFRNVIQERKDFNQYKFIDFCRVLNFDIYENRECGIIPNEELSRFLDTVSKVSQIVEHLYCDSCNSILFPYKRSDKEHISSYNTFHCQNQSCSEFEKRIYISHCHTTNCKGVIDSRKQKKCSNGMHICSNCFGCCTDEFFIRQKKYKEEAKTNISQYLENAIQNHLGHNDKDKFFCYTCGNELIDKKCPQCGIEHKNSNRFWYIKKKKQ